MALRFFQRYCLRADSCLWACNPFIHRDGIGGHIHFGRLRPNREAEIRALDKMCELLVDAEIFSRAEVTRRRQGDQFGQRYGTLGDVRLQAYGYEYRALPSWLGSPEVAFVVLTLGKLVVHCPEVTDAWATPPTRNSRPLSRIAAVFDKWAPQDDDARLAQAMLGQRSVREWRGSDWDLKSAWGIPHVQSEHRVEIVPNVFPASELVPGEAELAELFQKFTQGKPLRAPVEGDLKLLQLPENFTPLLGNVNVVHAPGLGELLVNLIVPKGYGLTLIPAGNENVLRETGRPEVSVLTVSTGLLERLSLNQLNEVARQVFPGEVTFLTKPDNGLFIGVPTSLRGRLAAGAMRKFLLSGLFPIFDIQHAPEAGWDWVFGQWKAEELGVTTKFAGKLIHTES